MFSADNYVKPNKNCNLTSWFSGCEPGRACSDGKGKDVDMKNKKEMPSRTLDCLPCCESFFLPTRAYLHDALPSRCLLSSCRTQQNYWLHKTKSPSIPINLLLGMKAISVEQQTCGEMLCLPKRYFVLQDIIVKLLQRKLLAPRDITAGLDLQNNKVVSRWPPVMHKPRISILQLMASWFLLG
ncbi:putative white-brown complex homolog protein 30 isoform X2 [Apium graveolens]|uniref:putative white-brown complex homolog protein 30 isoform X2 n=1 Tax=Apium graveolens TaxID=4045 RepID=UPI003D7ADAC6